jgi:CRISPR/Cas system CSM-associated protein Csm3 (group 7 of RAMP superfamily)
MPSDRSKAVVKMTDFGDDMKALAEYLLELADNEEEYNKYFEWKKEVALDRFQGVLDMTAYKYTSLCRICEKVHNDKVSL